MLQQRPTAIRRDMEPTHPMETISQSGMATLDNGCFWQKQDEDGLGFEKTVEIDISLFLA